MGLRDARRRFIEALEAGNFEHEARDAQAEKNLLAAGHLDVEEVIRLLQRCRGRQYRSSPHHLDADTLVHEFRPRTAGRAWYVKGYFQAGVLILISVHRS